MRYTYAVMLTDETTGTVESDSVIDVGMVVTVSLTDENGNFIKKKGYVQEILTEEENY